MRNQLLCVFFAGIAIVLPSIAVSATAPEQETLNHLNNIRAIKAGGSDSDVQKYNRQMDEAWAFFNKNKGVSLPVLRAQLTAELGKSARSELLVMDSAYFLQTEGESGDKTLARRALFSLDTSAEIIRWNHDELFKFSHAVAPDRDPKFLEFVDKNFLRGKVTVIVPQHALTLDETLVCVFLYGAYGRDVEEHLLPFLRDPALQKKVIEILTWLGSPKSVNAVASVITSSPNYDTFARATGFMMGSGGPESRSAMLAIDPQKLDAKSRDYFAGIRARVQEVSFESQSKQFDRMPGEIVKDEELKKRLAAMYENFGNDDKTSPKSVLVSTLPREYLIEQLARIRARTFQRISDEALSDVEVTNVLINTLRYRQD